MHSNNIDPYTTGCGDDIWTLETHICPEGMSHLPDFGCQELTEDLWLILPPGIMERVPNLSLAQAVSEKAS